MDKETIKKIKAAIDIVDVVGEYVDLKQKGANYVGLCPFHDDHTPSFYVSPLRKRCRCFVCDEGSDAIGFLMKKLGISFPEALKKLAEKYSIVIPERYLPKDEWIKQKDMEAMLTVNEATMEYYEACLHNPDETTGINYFRQRGFTYETLKKFHAGYAPVTSDVIGAVKAKGLKTKYLMPTGADVTYKSGSTLHVRNGVGTVFQTNDGHFIDAFAGRVIFPWINVSGKVVGFGGRKLDSATKGVEMKYRNSLDSLIYNKGKELWGLFQAKNAIIKENKVYMVEGYTDVMMFHQIGIENVVANSGTALNEEQVKLLSRYTNNVTLIYDSDKAGINAAQRAITLFLKHGMNVNIVMLPEGEDPDSFARNHTAEEVKAYLNDNKQNFVSFLNSILLAPATEIPEKSEAINTILANISLVKDAIPRELYIMELSKVSDIDIQILRNCLDVRS